MHLVRAFGDGHVDCIKAIVTSLLDLMRVTPVPEEVENGDFGVGLVVISCSHGCIDCIKQLIALGVDVSS